MKYIIYEMVQPSHLKEVKQEGYGYTKTIYRNVLEEIDYPYVESKHDSFDSAVAEITKNAEKLKNLELTIIPVISISWDAEIS